MKPVKRSIRKHYGLTAKQVAVRSKRPWFFEWIGWLVCGLVGFGVAYFIYNYNHVDVESIIMENQSLSTQIIKLERQLQMSNATQQNFQEELKAIQDENIKMKEDLLFYKNMTEKNAKKKN